MYRKKMQEPGIQIRILDASLQAYLQRYPFATGPDEATNIRARAATSEAISFREIGPATEPTLLHPNQTLLPPADLEKIQTLFNRIGVSACDQKIHINDFAWEANLLPRHSKKILVIGCGDGVELIFLRAILPEAHIAALDYHNALLPGLAEAVGLTFLQGDMHTHLQSLLPEFDLIFSNHTLEHLYDPDRTLGILASLLIAGGHIVSILPMAGAPGTPFLQKIHTYIATRAETPVPLLDLVYFDLGHPWKTNPSDIVATLTRAGFADIEIFQRRDHLCRPTAVSAKALPGKRNRAIALHTALLTPLHTIANLLFPRDVPLRLRSLLFALERRLPFGTNRSMNAFCEEALFIGRKR